MNNTFSQIYIQVVFAVDDRRSLIKIEWEEKLYKYITGIIKNKKQKLIAINGMPDHIHFFIGMTPSCCLSDLVREVKKASNDYVNENKFSKNYFNWQEGFGAFSYGHSQMNDVYQYIMNQKQHHKIKSFKEEYIDLLKKFQIDYKEEYLFRWIE